MVYVRVSRAFPLQALKENRDSSGIGEERPMVGATYISRLIILMPVDQF
jgi:hypothetical protein